MTYLSVEEYRVRLNKDGTNSEGKMWLREGQEWEVEVAEGNERLTTKAEESNRLPHHLFTRVVERLATVDTRLFACGTCAHFRRGLHQQGNGWMGYCSYRGDHADAPPYPGEVALLAPDCHAFAYSSPDQPLVEAAYLSSNKEARNPEDTKSLPAAGRVMHEPGMLSKLRNFLGLTKKEQEMVRAGVVERPGGQPCPVCGTRMTNRASVANADQRGEERVLSVWRCPHCAGNYLDDWFEAYVGSRAHNAERLYVVPPVEADESAAIVVHCPRPDVKGCTCIANQHFDKWGNRLEKEGRPIKHRESVVSL